MNNEKPPHAGGGFAAGARGKSMRHYNDMPGSGQGISAESALAIIGPALGGRANGRGGYDLCACPVHGGHDCLSLDVGGSGVLLVRCHAGCTAREIFGALRASGLPVPDRRGADYAQARRATKSASGNRATEASGHAEAARLAQAYWRSSKPPRPDHPYLCAKGFTDWRLDRLAKASTILQDTRGCLVVPLFGATGELVTVQRIDRRGGKYLWKGGRKRGTFHPIGIEPGDLAGHRGPLCLTEGWATAAAIYLCTDFPAIMCVDAGNMPEAARIMRRLAPAADIILCADEDPAGIDAATKAARTVGGRIARPRDGAAEAAWRKGFDFWDLWHTRGTASVIAAVLEARP